MTVKVVTSEETRAAVLAALVNGPLSFDEIKEAVGQGISVVAMALGWLEAKNQVYSDVSTGYKWALVNS